MIDAQELREIMEKMGYSPEQIDAALKKHDYLKRVEEQMIEMAELLRQYMNEKLVDVLGEFETLAEYDIEIKLPKKEKRRPPRCIGPKNKAPQRVPRPARVARSSCRKFKKNRWRAFKEVRT